MVMVSLKPEPIPLNLKVILIGNEALYQTLISVDTDFRKLFKIKVEFEDDAPLTLENMNKLARVVEGFCQTEELPPLDRSGDLQMTKRSYLQDLARLLRLLEKRLHLQD